MNTLVYKNIFLLIYLAVIGFLFVDVGGNESLSTYSLWSRPEFWPRVILVGMGVTVVLRLYWPKKGSSSQKTVRETLSLLFSRRILLGILVVTLYCFSTQYLGFAFSTMVFLGIFMWYLGQKSVKYLILMPTVSVLFILFVFWRVLYVSLPKGSGIFLDFSNLILTIVRLGAAG